MRCRTLGQVAYEAWCRSRDGKIYSQFPWADVTDKQAWEDAADAVAEKAVADFRRLGD